MKKTDPKAGNDVYLTIDRDLQIGIYNLLEQQLAGIITNKLVNRDLEETEFTKRASQYPHSGEGCVLPAHQQQCAGHGRRSLSPGGVGHGAGKSIYAKYTAAQASRPSAWIRVVSC